MTAVARRPDQAADAQAEREAVIRVRGLSVGFGDTLILEDLDLDVWRGEILGIVGGSGTGKSVLLRSIIGLNRKRAGTVEVFGENLDAIGSKERAEIDRRWGLVF
jgi:phospholipid/cholesterol/gamma-HCH transport system ATP-binding protein